MRALLGPDEPPFRADTQVEAPVTETAGYLVLQGCRPHECPVANGAILVSSDLRHVHAVYLQDQDLRTYSDDAGSFPYGLVEALVAKWREAEKAMAPAAPVP